MFLGPLVTVIRSFGIILFNDVYIQLGFGVMVFLFDWGIFVYPDNKQKAHDELKKCMEDGQIARLEKVHAELTRSMNGTENIVDNRPFQTVASVDT